MKLKLSGVEVKAARVLVGMKGHRPSAKAACLGAALKRKPGQTGPMFPKPPAGMGGRNNPAVHKAFVTAAKACGFNITKDISKVK
jgi:hypothetical protein